MSALPPLPYSEWSDTLDTFHRWAQIVGKIRLALTPRVNHWWNVPLYVSAHGLTTSAIPLGERWFEIEFDFLDSLLTVRTSDSRKQHVALEPRSVADFYAAVMAALDELDIDVHIWTTPVEIANPIPFDRDEEHRSYDRDHVLRFWKCVTWTDAVLERFRAQFTGKCSPVHLYWGTLDLAVTRFSGRRAPAFEGSEVEREAYSHELISVGWWPGDVRFERAAFYAYASPEPPGFAQAQVWPAEAFYAPAPSLKGLYLAHDDVRMAPAPEDKLLSFYESTYAAAANLGHWPRADIERPQPETNHGELFTPGNA